MDDNIEKLLHSVERIITHLKHDVPPEAVVVEEAERLLEAIRRELNDKTTRANGLT
jgi:hypothetical protein